MNLQTPTWCTTYWKTILHDNNTEQLNSNVFYLILSRLGGLLQTQTGYWKWYYLFLDDKRRSFSDQIVLLFSSKCSPLRFRAFISAVSSCRSPCYFNNFVFISLFFSSTYSRFRFSLSTAPYCTLTHYIEITAMTDFATWLSAGSKTSARLLATEELLFYTLLQCFIPRGRPLPPPLTLPSLDVLFVRLSYQPDVAHRLHVPESIYYSSSWFIESHVFYVCYGRGAICRWPAI